MALAISTICDSIAALSVTGLTILDFDAIPARTDRGHYLYPNPINFVTDFLVEWDSYGADASAKKTVTYTLNYVFNYSPVGEGRAFKLDLYDDMVTMAFQIQDALIANSSLSGNIDNLPTFGTFGQIFDPSGNPCLGCDIRISVKEFVN